MVKHFHSLANFSAPDILNLIKRAIFFYQSPPQNINQILKNKIIANVFYEPSTRTRCSFEIAAKKLGAEVINFTPENSSVKKGESVYDTLKSFESMGADAIILRHSDDHIFENIYPKFKVPLINAGAGKFEHPTQGLLDLMTLYQEFKTLNQLKIGICGDTKHSRVAGSMIAAAEKFEMKIYLAGPENLQRKIESPFVIHSSLNEILASVDAIMLLRIQFERFENLEVNQRDYLKDFGLTSERINQMRKGSIIMHPGPFNRNIEIADDLVEHPSSRIFKQMENGVYARMSILEYLFKGQ
jgi:aspartate carbamoyltransferase catalytic subunit